MKHDETCVTQVTERRNLPQEVLSDSVKGMSVFGALTLVPTKCHNNPKEVKSFVKIDDNFKVFKVLPKGTGKRNELDAVVKSENIKAKETDLFLFIASSVFILKLKNDENSSNLSKIASKSDWTLISQGGGLDNSIEIDKNCATFWNNRIFVYNVEWILFCFCLSPIL